jgi:hypothetical protein
MPHANSRIHQRMFKGKAAAEQKAYQIITPVGSNIVNFVGQDAVTIDAVAGHIGADIGSGRKFPRFRVTSVKDFQERTGLGIALAKEQEVIGQLAGNNGQVSLRKPGRQASRGPAPLPSADGTTQVLWAETG